MINDYEATQPIIPEGDFAANTNQEAIDALNELIETCKDSQYGFETAAQGVNNPELKSTFTDQSQQRGEFADVLRGLVRSLGGDPESRGSVAGSSRRGWMEIKSAVSGSDDHAILVECESGEDSAKEAYNEALQKDLPPDIADVLRQQAQLVVSSHNKIKSMRDSGQQRSAAPGLM